MQNDFNGLADFLTSKLPQWQRLKTELELGLLG